MVNYSNIWKQLCFFQSASATQKFLKKQYEQRQIEQNSAKSTENCYPFMYYLEQAEIYYNQAAAAPFSIKPLLLFYGLTHLFKALLLAVDPDYPENTSVLAHGVSSRKRKKQAFHFFQDEIKIQKHGLFPHFTKKCFKLPSLEGEKVQMSDLFLNIPELDDTYLFLKKESHMVEVIEQQPHMFLIPNLTKMAEIKDYLQKYFSNKVTWLENETEEALLFRLDCQKPLAAPFRYHLHKKHYCLPAKQNKLSLYPELLSHYLMLYNLSMIARYETSWWCRFLKSTPTNDYPLIHSFLQITLEKTPFLAFQYLTAD